MYIDFKKEDGKILVFCNGEKLSCRWLIENHKPDMNLVEMVLYECKEHLLKELKELNDA